MTLSTIENKSAASAFVIYFYVLSAVCGGTLVGAGGTLNSPSYPLAYPTSTNCEWVIKGHRYHFLSFTFNSLNLSLADGQSCGDKTGDYIEIRSHNFTGL